MNAEGSQLAQVQPSGTAAVLGYSNPAVASGGRGLNAEVTLIVVCNTTASPVNFSIFHDKDGTTYDQSTALYYAKALAANDTLLIPFHAPNAGLAVRSGGNIGVQSSVANALTFTLYGVTQQVPTR